MSAERQYIAYAHGAPRFGVGGSVYAYVTELHPGRPVHSYRVKQYVGRGLARRATRYSAGCNHCRWNQPGFALRKDANAAANAHLAEEHPGKTHRMAPEYQMFGHCIRHAGAIYVPEVSRELRPFDPDEPTHRLRHDGIDDPGNRRVWRDGYVAFKSPAVSPVCPEHEEALTDWHAWLLTLDGQPAKYLTDGLRHGPEMTEVLPADQP